MNSVQLIGNLTRDPELRQTPSGVAVCDCGLAKNERFKNAAGEIREKVLFVDFTTWGKQAESLSKFMAKGSPVAVTGSLQLDQWENEKKEKRSKITVRADRVQFLHRAAGKPDPVDQDVPAGADADNIPF
jgi:single-strand DNA-binding protein